jgi:hypothetical protein
MFLAEHVVARADVRTTVKYNCLEITKPGRWFGAVVGKSYVAPVADAIRGATKEPTGRGLARCWWRQWGRHVSRCVRTMKSQNATQK